MSRVTLHYFLSLSLFLVAFITTSTTSNRRKYVGGATDSTALKTDAKYKELVTKYFQVVTPQNEMKWGCVEKTRGKLDTSGADTLNDFVQKNGKKIRGHNILANTQNPDWVGSLSKQDMQSAAFSYMELIFKKYAKNMISLDVCNEIVDGGALRQTVWLQKWGPEFVEEIYTKARELGKKYNPNLKLFLNDFGIEDKGSKSDYILQIATSLKKKGILDGVGFQSHFEVGKIPKGFQKNMERFTSAGLYVAISELDIRIKLQGRTDQEIQKDRDQQTKDFKNSFQICSNIPMCLGVTVWGITDLDSWIPKNSETRDSGEAVLFDKNYNPKQAFQEVQSYFKSSSI